MVVEPGCIQELIIYLILQHAPSTLWYQLEGYRRSDVKQKRGSLKSGDVQHADSGLSG